uniref:Salivary secreted peptide n=1 Tax=Bracon brevicornis TaxID=1563983 RepID=A0A6V7IZ11_9HYME
MYSKCTIIFALLAVLAFTAHSPSEALSYKSYAAVNNTNTHNLIVGNRLPGDRLMHEESIVKSSSFLQVTSVQKTFSVPRFERITQVVALDRKSNGAYARIVRGGPGTNNVTIKFKSQRNHGLNFRVQIYSRP